MSLTKQLPRLLAAGLFALGMAVTTASPAAASGAYPYEQCAG